MPPARDQGFTLIEMMVVLAILGLVIGVVIMHGPLRSTGLDARAAAGVLAQTFRTARATAIAKATTVAVAIDPERREFSADGGQIHKFANSVGVEVLPPARKGPGDVRLITFSPDGSASGGGVALTVGHRHLDVEVEWLTGRVKVTDAP
jgi:general secretion pathway protein H